MEMEDQRQEEIDCITAIFPEITIDPENPFRASLELPVHPHHPVEVLFPATPEGPDQDDIPTPPLSATSSEEEPQPAATINVDSHRLSYLPSLQLHITLPEGYPETHPPEFELSTSPPWLSRSSLDELEASGLRMWEEVGHDLVVFGYIDSLQQAAETAFGFGEEGNVLEISQDHRISILDFDIKASQAAFDKETFDCGVCLGKACPGMVKPPD
jgi:E3 ubiquitin-protein ligase RNF14